MNFSGITSPLGAPKETTGDTFAGELKNRLGNIHTPDAASAKEMKQLKEAVQGFESYFLYILMKEMRKTVPETGFINGGNAEKIFRDQLDQELTIQMAKAPGGIGIGKMLYDQLAKPMLKPTATADVSTTPIQGDSLPLRR